MKIGWQKNSILLLSWLLITFPAHGQHEEKEARLEFRVRYVTADAVYFNGGRRLGVRPGDKVWVMRNGQKLVQLEVKYVSAHNASCLLDPEKRQRDTASTVRVDDLVLWTIPLPEYMKRTRPPETPTPNAARIFSPNKTRSNSPKPKGFVPKRRSPNNELNGQISVQAFGQRDRSAPRFDFFESSAYLRLSLERLAGLPLRFNVRARSSLNRQQFGANSVRPRPAYRVYEITLEYTTPSAPMEFALGRMLRNEWRGAGYLDGVAFGYRFNETWKAGVFAGMPPDLYQYGFRTDEKKLGGFLQMKRALSQSAEIIFAATGVGQYLRRQISREYFAAEIDLNWMRQFYLTQYLEIDYNRNWRKTAQNNAIDLNNAYFNASYYPQSWISFGVSYDARRLIRTWETRSIADSLFDQALRQGWRASINLQPTALLRLTFDGGLQQHKGTPHVYSAGVSASGWNLLRSGLGLSARFSYFGNSFFSGYYPALEVSRSFLGVFYVTIGGGAYLYQMGNDGQSQSNPWERLRLDVNLTRSFFLSSTVENFHGDTMKFVRGFVDLGLRF
ncbi:MAG: hypothetical protein ONB46_01475 [candidate division KSB1 bacterium]|nr:hypothetical protein [candidate division KSB1 bacterium]MDZ7364336.1 hypothetical protein [candidate division KSB1 bacterium]MDZ7402708.1 hypothetical protein [candidate division KSB1 bacterium]